MWYVYFGKNVRYRDNILFFVFESGISNYNLIDVKYVGINIKLNSYVY